MSDREKELHRDDVASDASQEDGTSRRDFLRKNLKRSALLPYVAPVIHTIYLPTDAYATSPINNSDPNAPPPVDPPPVLTDMDPDNAEIGDRLNVTATGSDFVATPDFDLGVNFNVRGVTFISSSSCIVDLKVRNTAIPGTYDVFVVNPDGQGDILVNGFTVNAPPPPPTVISVTPDNADPGDTLDITIAGTDFVATPQVKIPSRVVENSVTFISSVSIICNIKVKNNAASGPRDVRVINPDSQDDTLVGGFTVN